MIYKRFKEFLYNHRFNKENQLKVRSAYFTKNAADTAKIDQTMKHARADHPLEEIAKVFRGRWRLVLVYVLLDGPRRFSDLQRIIPGISQRMLALDLRKLEEFGILSRNVLAVSPVRVEYQLTANGIELTPMINGLHNWGESFIRRQNCPNSRLTAPPD